MEKLKKYERLRMPQGVHLSVERHTVDDSHPQHWHSYFEIEIILSGSGKYVINDVAYDICPYSVFFLTSTDFHYLEVSEATELVNVSFDSDMLEDKEMTALVFGRTKKAYVFEQNEHALLVDAANILMHECKVSGDCQSQLLQYLLKCLLRKNDTHDSASYEHEKGIKQAIAYMEMHFTERLSLDSVASIAGYSPAYFSDLFTRLTGETYTEALTKLRLSHARSMLANGYSVADSCFLSGFGSLSNFLEIFKKRCGIPPSKYRKSITQP